jgi:translocation and assembly module TamB
MPAPARSRRKSRPKAPLALRIAAWAGGLVVGLIALAALAAVAIDTGPGHRLLTGLAQGRTLDNGLKIGLGGIDGSIYRRMTLRGLTLSDPTGAFLTTPALTVDWRPGQLFDKHILLEELSADTVRVLRSPELKPAPPPKPGEPLVPDIYFTLNKLHVGSLILEPALTGDRRSLGLDGSAELLHGQVKADFAALARTIDGHAGGDRLTVKLDAAPDQNRLTLDAHLVAPKDGVVGRLAKLDGPLSFDLDGSGDWKAWNGKAKASFNGQPLLDATLTGRDGLFAAKGRAQPALMVKGPPAELTAPGLDFDLSGQMPQDRQLDAKARLASAAIEVNAAGRFDLARSRYVGVRADARLLKPEAASPQLTGKDMGATLAIEGAFAQPVIDYDVKASRVGFGETVIENLHASGKARIDAQQTLRLPVQVTADRVLGLNAAVGGLVTHLRADGDLSISAKQIATDNLRIRSDRLDATLVMALSLDTGRYDAVLKGRINRYQVEGLGLVDVVTDARLVPTGKGEFRIAGHVHAETLKLDNASAAEFLGGNAVIDADFSRSPSGVFGIANLKLNAPKFRILNGQGTYAVDGKIAFHAQASSDLYGPATLDVGGTATQPTLHLLAPGLEGGPIKDLDLQLKGTAPNVYLITAKGGTLYGPLSAELLLKTEPGMMSAEIHRASLADLNLTGQVHQTPDGPFAGTLLLKGSGLDGTVRLAAAGEDQRVDVALRAADARLPLQPTPVTIAKGVINATAILYPDKPQVTADIDLQGVRQADLLVANAKAKIDYRDGSGKVDVTADGQSGVPFQIAANAGISPELIRVNGEGSINRIPIRLDTPAEIRKEAGGYRLASTAISAKPGKMLVSGFFGDQTTAAVKLDNLDLSVIQAFAPDLEITGKATGDLNFNLAKGADMPTGRADLKIIGFSRVGLAGASEPVDVTFLGGLTPAGAQANAMVKRRGAVIGRLQGKLGPAAAGAAPWMDRLKSAPLSVGLRYNGPAEALWALGGISGQELSGPLAIGADVTGRLDQPQINGVIRSQNLRYANAAFGTVIDQIVIDGRFAGTRFELAKMTARAGSGGISASGTVDLSSQNGFPIDMGVKFAKAELAKSEMVSATIDGDLKITNSRGRGGLIAGQLNVDQVRYQVAPPAAAQVADLEGVRRKGDPLVTPASLEASGGPPSVWKLDVGVHAANRLFVGGMGLDAEWASDLKITGDATHPIIVGDIKLVRGTFSFAGRDLDITRGFIRLDGSPVPNPTLDIEASTMVNNVTAVIDIRGTALSPQIIFTSTPELPQDEVISRLLFGSSVTELSPLQAVQLAAALNSLRSGGVGAVGKLRNAAGVDRLKFNGADQATGRGPSIGAGKYITKNIYVEVITDGQGYTATQIEFALSRTLKLLSQLGSLGGSKASLRYSKDY